MTAPFAEKHSRGLSFIIDNGIAFGWGKHRLIMHAVSAENVSFSENFFDVITACQHKKQDNNL